MALGGEPNFPLTEWHKAAVAAAGGDMPALQHALQVRMQPADRLFARRIPY